jgi:hypothetical protein
VIGRTSNQRQDYVALSTSEIMAASLCGQGIVYIRAFLRDFGVPLSEHTAIYEENLACKAMSTNSFNTEDQ